MKFLTSAALGALLLVPAVAGARPTAQAAAPAQAQAGVQTQAGATAAATPTVGATVYDSTGAVLGS